MIMMIGCLKMTDITSYEKLLVSTFDVYRNVTSSDSIGGRSSDYQLQSTIKGRLSTPNRSANEVLRAGQDLAKIDYVLFTLASVDVQDDDYLVGENRNLRVMFIRNPSHIEHHLEIYVEEVQPEVGIPNTV